MKKILSLILALSLIISVAPMSFAIKKDEAVPTVDATFSAKPGMYFNFSAENWNWEKDMVYADIKKNDLSDNPEYATTNTDPWRVAGWYNVGKEIAITLENKSETTSTNAAPKALYWKSANFAPSSNSPQSGIALGVYIDETGFFTPSIKYQESSDSCRVSIFLAPRDAFGHNGYNNRKTDVNDSDIYFFNNALTKSCFSSTGRNSNLTLIGTQSLYKANPSTEPQTQPFSPVLITEPGFYYLYILPHRIKDTEPNTGYMNLYSIEFKPEPQMTAAAAFTATQDPEYSSENAPETASVKTLALYGDTSVVIETADVTYGESTEIPAVDKTYTDEETGDAYTFLYWAKGLDNGVGNKHIISTSNEQFSYKPHEGANYLIAVYEKEGEEKEAAFYDRNGQLLDPEITDNKLPALPAMAGLGDAIGWEQLGTGEIFAEGDDFSTLEGDKVFMAKYDEPEADITINGESYSYGDVVSCKDIVNFDETTFSYWTRTIGSGKEEIMSIDPDYSFSAYTDCTIKAVCKGNVELANPRKIALSTFSVGDNLTAVMAEFIGFEGAKEKGIMFGTKKIAMTSDYAQFTVTNDTAASVTVTGYAIVDEAGTTVKYTDGSISVPGATAE